MNPESTPTRAASSRFVSALVFGFGLVVAVAGFVSVCLAQTPLPPGWMHQDVGVAEVAGSASHANGVYSLKGTQDIWGTNDGFHFVYQAFTGDGEMVARVKSVQNTLNHAKGGVMIREALAPGAKEVCMAVTPVDGAQFLFRPEANGPTKVAKLGGNKGTFPYWVKLTRKGNTFTGYESLDGKDWKQTGSTNVVMGAGTLIGLTSCSHVKNVLCESVFDEVCVKAGK
jgi:hypothetical protein